MNGGGYLTGNGKVQPGGSGVECAARGWRKAAAVARRDA